MSFDKDKIKDMEYDPARGRYVGKDGSEFRVTPFSDGSGYKYDYYPSTTYGNEKHDSVHVKSDLNENWSRTDNNRETGTQDKSSGSGCYLTSACMKFFQENFDDNCYELTVLRWFRDNFVTKEDIEHYYEVAPIIVDAIEKEEKKELVYDYIYENVVSYCVEEIEKGNYNSAYTRYKSSVQAFENTFVKPYLGKRLIKTLQTN